MPEEMNNESRAFSFCLNLVPRVFVPLDQRSENESSGSNHFSGVRRRCSQFEENMRLRSETGWAEFGYFEMVAPRALVFRPLVKGNKDSGNEIAFAFKFIECPST